MVRVSRIVVPDLPHHLIQRGNDRQPIFRDEEDFRAFYAWLREASKRFKVAIHAYVLMANHFHLLATPSDERGLALMMQWVGRFYVPYFNKKYDRTGTLWQGRFRTSLIETDQYFLACSRYIEMNPVRAGLVATPSDYRWSSYAHHVGDKPDSLIADHALYWALGNTPFEREAAYARFVQQAAPQLELDSLRSAVRKGVTLGSDQFKRQLEKRMKRSIVPGKRGRPFKQKIEENQ
ncbi:MAG: transposase [Oxalobacter sp.]|nr:MAG: transposase [Oxalobacter sp.]